MSFHARRAVRILEKIHGMRKYMMLGLYMTQPSPRWLSGKEWRQSRMELERR